MRCAVFQIAILALAIVSVLHAWVSPSLAQENSLLSKSDSEAMFAMSKSDWEKNVQLADAAGAGMEGDGLHGSKLLAVDVGIGLLTVEPVYPKGRVERPIRLIVTSIYQRKDAVDAFTSMSEVDAEWLINETMRQMQPEFSVIGYLRRAPGIEPRVSFSIFEKGTVPDIDAVNNDGSGCFESCINPSRSLQ